MKKLLTIAVAIMLAAATQAAAVGWTLAGATAYAGGAYSVFAIGVNEVTSIAQITDLVAAGKDVAGYQIGGGTVTPQGTAVVGNSTANAGSITYDEQVGGQQKYQVFAVVWSADGKTASASSPYTVTLANNSTSVTALFANQSTNLANNKFDVVPEPTTVALLALGLAALGLKRKVA